MILAFFFGHSIPPFVFEINIWKIASPLLQRSAATPSQFLCSLLTKYVRRYCVRFQLWARSYRGGTIHNACITLGWGYSIGDGLFCPSTYETRSRLRFSAKKLKIFLKNWKTHSVGGKNPLSECVFCVRMIVTSFYHRLRDCRSARLVRWNESRGRGNPTYARRGCIWGRSRGEDIGVRWEW